MLVTNDNDQIQFRHYVFPHFISIQESMDYFVQDCSTYRQPKSSAIFLHRARGIEFHFNCLLQLVPWYRGTMLFEHKNLVRLSLQSLGFGRDNKGDRPAPLPDTCNSQLELSSHEYIF